MFESKLTDTQRAEILGSKLVCGWDTLQPNMRDIARPYGVSHNTIRNVYHTKRLDIQRDALIFAIHMHQLIYGKVVYVNYADFLCNARPRLWWPTEMNHWAQNDEM